MVRTPAAAAATATEKSETVFNLSYVTAAIKRSVWACVPVCLGATVLHMVMMKEGAQEVFSLVPLLPLLP